MPNDLYIFCCPIQLTKGPGLMDGKYLWAIPVMYYNNNFNKDEKVIDVRIYRASRKEAHARALRLGNMYRVLLKKGRLVV